MVFRICVQIPLGVCLIPVGLGFFLLLLSRIFFYNGPGFFRLTMFFFFPHMTSSEERMQENGGLNVFSWFLLHFSVCKCIYSRPNGSLSLQHELYQLCFALTSFYNRLSFLSIFKLKLLGTDEKILH